MTVRHVAKDATVLGHKIPKGTDILFSFRYIHRNKEIFPNPDEFNPDRWLEDDRGGNKRKIFPFGEGPKMCVGQKLATLELKVVMARFYQHFDVKFVPGFQLNVVHTVTMGPKENLLVNLQAIR